MACSKELLAIIFDPENPSGLRGRCDNFQMANYKPEFLFSMLLAKVSREILHQNIEPQ
jgi:hypothetical protein